MILARWLVLALTTTLLACSSDKPPETPPAPTDATPDSGEANVTVQTEQKTTEVAQPKVTMTGAPVAPGGGTNDYTVTEHDCDELGKAYGAVTRTDLESQLPAKLTDKQRASTGRSIDKAAAKMERQAGDQCRASLLNNVFDQAALQCAMAAKTAKAYDTCLNGSSPAPKK
ncbi:MAG TPA: hypothetical protein VGM56_33910 [Byssovorax sp.]|jgi:hypothetical protein